MSSRRFPERYHASVTPTWWWLDEQNELTVAKLSDQRRSRRKKGIVVWAHGRRPNAADAPAYDADALAAAVARWPGKIAVDAADEPPVK